MYKCKISVNGHYDATKGKEYNNDKVAKGWSTSEYTWAESSVLNLTTQHGISCNEYSTEHKVNENWVGTNAIMLDLDNGVMTKEKLWSCNKKADRTRSHAASFCKLSSNCSGDKYPR